MLEILHSQFLFILKFIFLLFELCGFKEYSNVVVNILEPRAGALVVYMEGMRRVLSSFWFLENV